MPKNTPNNPRKPLYPPKNYKKWSKLKSQINNNTVKHHPYREGNVYWFNLGENIGVEEDGKGDLFSRPALAVRGFSGNLIWIVPLSHTSRSGEYYHRFTFKGDPGAALLSQLRSIDTARISGRSLGKISDKDFRQIRHKLQAFLDLDEDTTP